MIQKPDFLKLSTDTFDDISIDNRVARLHNCVTDAVPSKFDDLMNCGLISNLLTRIVILTNSLNEKADSFKTQIDAHKEAVVCREQNLLSNLASLPNIEVDSFGDFSDQNFND